MIVQSPGAGGVKKMYRSPGKTSGWSTPSVAPSPASAGFNTSPSAKKTLTNGSKGNSGRKKSDRKQTKLLSPGKLILWSVALGLAGTLYLTHVFQTQNTLQEVQQIRIEHERAQRIHTEARRNYEQMTGPAEIYSRAQSLGMISGGATDPVIIIEK